MLCFSPRALRIGWMQAGGQVWSCIHPGIAAVDGERPVIPRDVDARLATLLKRCWDEDPQARPSFEEIVQSLAIYSHDVFQTDDREVALAKDESGCACVIS